MKIFIRIHAISVNTLGNQEQNCWLIQAEPIEENLMDDWFPRILLQIIKLMIDMSVGN